MTLGQKSAPARSRPTRHGGNRALNAGGDERSRILLEVAVQVTIDAKGEGISRRQFAGCSGCTYLV